jgi:hypothetical protein
MAETVNERHAREELQTAIAAVGIAGGARPRGMAAAQARGGAVDPQELCQKYTTLKPKIDGALKYIKLIPRWGDIIVNAIQTLEKIADGVCKLVPAEP